MKKVIAIIAIIAIIAAPFGAWASPWKISDGVNSLVKYQREGDPVAFYVHSFVVSFARGVELGRGKPLETMEAMSIYDRVFRCVREQVVPQLRHDGLYEEWTKVQLDPETLKCGEAIARAKDVGELFKIGLAQLNYNRERFPELMKHLEEDQAYACIMRTLIRDIMEEDLKGGAK